MKEKGGFVPSREEQIEARRGSRYQRQSEPRRKLVEDRIAQHLERVKARTNPMGKKHSDFMQQCISNSCSPVDRNFDSNLEQEELVKDLWKCTLKKDKILSRSDDHT